MAVLGHGVLLDTNLKSTAKTPEKSFAHFQLIEAIIGSDNGLSPFRHQTGYYLNHSCCVADHCEH